MKTRYETKTAVFLVLTREVEGKTELLLQKRQNTGYMDGKYDMACSGHLEKGESLTMAVVRESLEELGIQIQEKDLHLVCVIHPYEEDYLNIFFSADSYEGIPKIKESEKCSELTWFPMNQLPENTIERIKKVVDCMKYGIVYDDGNFSHLEQLKKEKL